MKKPWMMLVFSLVLTMVACTTKPLPTTDPNDPKPNEELPIDNSRFFNPFGFSSLVITTRESHSPHVVSDVVTFLDALLDQTIPVIRIDADLSLGSKTVNVANPTDAAWWTTNLNNIASSDLWVVNADGSVILALLVPQEIV